MTVFVFDGISAPKRLLFQGNLTAVEGNDYILVNGNTGTVSNPNGYTYTPLTGTPFLQDTNTGTWDGTLSRPQGIYNFDLQSAQNNLPNTIKAISIYVSGQPGGASQTIKVTSRGSSTPQMQMYGTIGTNSFMNGIVNTDIINNDISIYILTGTAINCLCQALGYFS